MPALEPTRSVVRRNRLVLLALWFFFYASFALVTPPLLDDADSVHAEVAREMTLRHDYVTLYANGIRYLEKAPLLYWSMAASFEVFGVRTAAARLPLAFTVLALAMAMEAFGRRALGSGRAGLYAGLMLLSSFGVFIFTRINIPDAMVCLWTMLAIFFYWLSESGMREFVATEEPRSQNRDPSAGSGQAPGHPVSGRAGAGRVVCWGFAAACALNVLTKGLIGVVFPVLIVLAHLLLTRRSLRGVVARLGELAPASSAAVFLLIAAPWHLLIALANPAQGHPGGVDFQNGHWTVPLPTDGNVHGWLWFYFINEQVMRYLNLRVPRDYDTVPLALFWGLLLVWLMPWSGFLFRAAAAVPWGKAFRPLVSIRRLSGRESTLLLLGLWALIPMLFFSFSTRQEYYVLPALPAMILLIAAWLDAEALEAESFAVPSPLVRSGQRIAVVLLVLGSLAALAALFLAVHAQPPDPHTDLAALLQQNPGEYALSFGHFLDLNARAMGAFRQPLLLAACAFFFGPLANWLLRRDFRPHAGNLALAAASFLFLLAAHIGLQTFAPVLSSRQLARAVAPVIKRDDLVVIHGEYESGSTLGFYLGRPGLDAQPVHILDGRSSNLWYGSFFPDAPRIFEDDVSLSLKWTGPRRIFLWQDLSEPVPTLPGRTYFVAQSGGKEILSNQPNAY